MTIQTWNTPQSSNIEALGHDDETGEGTVTFKNGGTYTIDAIARAEMEEWAASPSPGGYMNRHIKPSYRVRRA